MHERKKKVAQARRRILMPQHQEEIEEEVRKMLTSQVLMFHLLQKITLRVSKCIICNSSLIFSS
jgi:hypothetical protein